MSEHPTSKEWAWMKASTAHEGDYSVHWDSDRSSVGMFDEFYAVQLVRYMNESYRAGKAASAPEPCPSHAHPSCPLCNPDKTVPELNRAAQQPGNALLGAAQVRVQHYEKALRDIGACISGHDSVVCQDVADIIEKALYSDTPTQPPGEDERLTKVREWSKAAFGYDIGQNNTTGEWPGPTKRGDQP